MTSRKIDKLIINSPYTEPVAHWQYDRQTQSFSRVSGRRSAGYLIASPDSKTFDDPGIFVEIPLVNRIRERIRDWRDRGYPGTTAMTRRLLDHWSSQEDMAVNRFFFCQIEAIETLIWLTEANQTERTGIDIPNDGGAFTRYCAKMATGTGKTVVMAMVIAWHVLNKVASPQDKRFSKNVLIIAPGLTVRNRLAVLQPSQRGNYYKQFNIVPSRYLERLNEGKVLIHNWHKLDWESDEQISRKKGVDKRGALSDPAYARVVLGDLARYSSLLVINDEAHHAWRVPAESKLRGVKKDEILEATKWIGGLDRINRTQKILTCYDFSATPFAPSGKRSNDEALFEWIVSDFGLNDAIESGLVKTPRVVIRDDKVPDARTYRSRLYHIYNDDTVRPDLNRRSKKEEPLPDLVRNAYYLLGLDWQETAIQWRSDNQVRTPPVMITVANRTETAARVKHTFDRKEIDIAELSKPDYTLHIDSTTLRKAEADSDTRTTSAKQKEERLRQLVDTVGKEGEPGEQIRNVISVGMLSEGWDTKTVTHIMGLRAFSSQLLCEQVVGRGLRRTSYEVDETTGLLDPEYVNIFGVPFTFLPHEGDIDTGGTRKPPKATVEVKPLDSKQQYEIRWPNVVRINYRIRRGIETEWSKIEPLHLDASEIIESTEIATILDGKPDVETTEEKVLEWSRVALRDQTIIFRTAAQVLEQRPQNGNNNGFELIGELISLVERFIRTDLLNISPDHFNSDEELRRGVISMSMSKVVNHIWEQIRFTNAELKELIFDSAHPISSTSDMVPWYTRKPCSPTEKSHINHCVFDSSWESTDAYVLDHHKLVEAWVKNDHLGFDIDYRYKGVLRKYIPDFLIRLTNGQNLVLETKGVEKDQDLVKQRYLAEWIDAVNHQGGFGVWSSAVSKEPGAAKVILDSLN